MSALAPRNSFRIAEEQGWLESSDNVELSPAALWAPDYEDEDETTLQGRRVDVQRIARLSANMEEEGLFVDTPRQVRILDESAVLPGEASFATVSLNQPFKESVLKPLAACDPISTSGVDDYPEQRSASRVRVLDESWVLDGEASFATVMSGERSKAHSPIAEFLVKTKLSSKQLVLATLALVSVLALAVTVLWGVTRSEVVTVSSAPTPTKVETASQPLSTSTETPKSALISNSQGGVSGSTDRTEAVATTEETPGVAEAKLIERTSSDESRKAPASDGKSGAVRSEIPEAVNAAGARVSAPKERVLETKKQSASVARKAVKERASVPNPSVRSEARETRPEPATKKTEAPVAVENVETKTPAVTGGGTRPRTVTRKPSP